MFQNIVQKFCHILGLTHDTLNSEFTIFTFFCSTDHPSNQGEVKIRVDFDGNIVNPLSDVSWREGLHHHGEDEQLPGYTLQELLGLSNSRLFQQRQAEL